MHILHMRAVLKVQEYLRTPDKSLDTLKVEHGINYKIENGKVSLSYHQIDAKESDPIACECRGLVLDAITYERIAVPMFRFFNLGQSNAAKIDWESAAYEEKRDGSLAIIYFHNSQWYMATRGVPEASAKAHSSDMTFAQLFNYTVKHMFGEGDVNWLMRDQSPNLTYCFELTTPVNRVVVKYEEPSLTLLAVRDRDSLQELDPRPFASALNIPSPKLFHFNNTEHMLEVIREWNPIESEGVVAKDKHFNRIKVKNPSYIAYNKLHDSLSTSWRGCVEIVLLEQDDDVVPMMPAMIANRILALKETISMLLKTVEAEYELIKDIESDKEFALKAKAMMWPAAMFNVRRGKAKTTRDYVQQYDDRGCIKTGILDAVLELCYKLNPGLKE